MTTTKPSNSIVIVNLPIVSYAGMACDTSERNNSFVLPPINDMELNKIIEAHRASQEGFGGSNITQKSFSKFRDHICRSVLGMQNGSYQQLRALWKKEEANKQTITLGESKTLVPTLHGVELTPEFFENLGKHGWALWDISESHADIEYDVTYKAETEDEDRHSFNCYLNWNDENPQIRVGINIGDGMTEDHFLDDDNRPFEEQIVDAIIKIGKENKTDKYIQLVNAHPIAHSKILEGAKNLSKEFGRPAK